MSGAHVTGRDGGKLRAILPSMQLDGMRGDSGFSGFSLVDLVLKLF